MGPGLCPGVGRGSPAGWCRGFTLLAGATVSLKQRFPSCPQIDVWVEARLQKIIYAGAAPQSSCGFRIGEEVTAGQPSCWFNPLRGCFADQSLYVFSLKVRDGCL